MALGEIFSRFVAQAPVPVMARGTLEWALSPKWLEELFEETAQRQRLGELAFSALVDLMGMVVCKTRKSMHAAYQAHQGSIQVAVKSVYNKLNRLEPGISAELVRRSAARLGAVIGEMRGGLPEILPGYRVKILDGNHLAATQHRLQELRTRRAGPLPGQALVVLDPQTKLIVDVYPCEDAYAQERSLVPELVENLRPGEVWIADRNFCTSLWLFEIALNKSFFIIREHAVNVRWESRGPGREVGRGDSGRVWEEPIHIFDGHGGGLDARRITVKLDQPTQDGDAEIQILTNLPSAVQAVVISAAYRQRWTIEAAFNELTLSLRCEINTLGYPRAALFGFCVATVIYNVLSVLLAAIRAAHGPDQAAQVSHYYLADEISSILPGMMIAIPDRHWPAAFGSLSVKQLARLLLQLAQRVDLPRFRKHPRGPKRPPPPRVGSRRQPHLSTARLLAQRKQNN